MLKKTLGVILLILESFVYYWLYKTMHLNPPMLQTGLGLYIVYLFIFGHYRITDTLVWDDIKRLLLATFLYMVTYAIIMPSTAYNGENLAQISKMMGHSQVNTTLHYLRDAKQDKDMSCLFEKLGSQKTK